MIVNWKTTDASSHLNEFKCPGCNANYVGKPDCCLYNRIKEHSCHDSSEIYNQMICKEYENEIEYQLSLTYLIFTSTKIIEKSKHWSVWSLIVLQESIAINELEWSLKPWN